MTSQGVARPIGIGVIGEQDASPAAVAAAEEVGRLIAQRGGIILCGGLGGVMEAAARGSSSAGGTVIGILPGDHSRDANPHVTIPIATGMGEARNVIIARAAQAIIAIGGAYGTLSEIAHALRGGVPVIGLDTWSITKPGGFADPIFRAKTPTEAVDQAFMRAVKS